MEVDVVVVVAEVVVGELRCAALLIGGAERVMQRSRGGCAAE